MTKEEIRIFLHNEELVPVIFLHSYEGLGFVADTSKGDAEIPEGFRANIPFWLARILANPTVNMAAIEEPKWLEKVGPGSNITQEVSYDFGANIGMAAGKQNTVVQLIELCKSRIGNVLNSSFKVKARQLDKQDPVFLEEEKEIVENTREAYQSYLQWKTED